MYRKYPIWILILLITAIICGSCTTWQDNDQPLNKTFVSEILEKISADSIEANIRQLAAFQTRHTMSDTASDSIGIGAARRWIYATFNRYRHHSDNRLKVKYDVYIESTNSRISQPTKIVNIVGILPGMQLESKDRVYIVNGHYDSRVSDIMNDSSYAPGANDDASGTAAVMELARVMSNYEFDATIIFMTVAGEEQGLLGARHFAKKAKSRNMNIAAMFTNDIIGNTKKNTDGSVHDHSIRVFAQGIPPEDTLSAYYKSLLSTGGENDTPSRQIARFIRRISHDYMSGFEVNIIYRKDRYLRGGDHSAFLAKGYPAVRFSEPHEYYERQHQDVRKENGIQYGDLPKFVDYDYVARVTKLNAASLTILANAPAKPQDPGVEVAQLENNTTLRWAPNKEPDLKGYEVVWRKTHAPFWEFSEFVGDTTTYTVNGISKDNYLFGIRSVDTFGNKSPAVYPLPIRD